MSNTNGIITESVRDSIVAGQVVYGSDGKESGTVDVIDPENGYFMVEKNLFSERDLYVPFRLITNIDPRELYVSVPRADLYRDYANPPPRTTHVEIEDGHEVATTTEPSGYDGTPIVVRRARVADLKENLAVGDYVLSSDLRELGVIKHFDPAKEWMWVVADVLVKGSGMKVPVALVDVVNRDTNEVFLIMSEADLREREHLEPEPGMFAAADESSEA